MPCPSAAFIGGEVRVDGNVGRGPPAFARIGLLAEIGKVEEIECAEALYRPDPHHRLTELHFLLYRVFDDIGLVHHIDQMHGLCHAPENLAGADVKLPVARIMRVARLADVPVAAAVIVLVEAGKGREDERLVVIVPQIFRRHFARDGERRILLARVRGGLRKDTQFRRNRPAQAEIARPRRIRPHERCGGGKKQSPAPRYPV